MEDSRNKIIFIGLLFWAIYALIKEYGEHDDCFRIYIPRKGESIYRSAKKLEKCIKYDMHTIKWRRTLICSIITIILIYVLIHSRIPTAKELILHFLFIFIVFYLSWKNYVSRTANKAITFANKHVENIKESIRTNHTFILPFEEYY